MKVKRFLAFITAAIMMSALSACGDNAASSEEKTTSAAAEQTEVNADNTESEPEKLPETDEEWHQAMLDKAMVSYGNTILVQNVINKAQAGENVTLAYLGGSITEGISAGPEGCYAKLTYDHFAEKFGTGSNVKYHNAGLSGTPSKLGILRLDRDVLSAAPDLVFIEFAVNDGTEPDYQNAYESIVQTLLKRDIAVVLLFSVTESDHSAQDYMKQIGEAYHLPMISYCDALRYLFANGRMTWQDFSDDQSHPNDEGHKLVAEMVNYYFDTVTEIEPEGDYIMPADTVFSPRETDAHMVESDAVTPVEYGSWKDGSDIASFDKGWVHRADADNEPIIFELDAKFVYLIYKEVKAGNYGSLHVRVEADGELYDESDYNAVSPSGWGNAQVVNIAMNPDVNHYRIEISMSDGSEETYGEILAFGYTS